MLVLEYYEGESVLFSTLWRNYWAVEELLSDQECDDLEARLMLIDALWECRQTREAVMMHRAIAKLLTELGAYPRLAP